MKQIITLFKNKYRIPSSRMPGWDYARSGKYYITIVTQNRICCFGDVKNGEMQLNEMGKIANDLWLQIPEHFENTFLDEHVVMPNHIHGVVVMKRSGLLNRNNKSIVNGENGTNDRYVGTDHHVGVVHHVETLHATSLHAAPNTPHITAPNTPHNTPHNTSNNIPDNSPEHSHVNREFMAQISPKPGALNTIIRSFKSACTKKFNESHLQWFGWQSRFYDEIIRNDNRLQQIQEYIKNNPNNLQS